MPLPPLSHVAQGVAWRLQQWLVVDLGPPCSQQLSGSKFCSCNCSRTKAPKCHPVLQSNHFPIIFWHVRAFFDGWLNHFPVFYHSDHFGFPPAAL